MGREWLWWLGEFGLAATVAVVAGFVTGDVPISILYGLFVGTVFFALREHRRVVAQHERQVAEMEDKVLDLPVTLSKLGETDPYLRRLVHLAKDETIRYARGAVDGEIIVKDRNILQEAIDMYKQAKPGEKIFSTNYWSGFSTPQSDVYRRTIIDLAASGVDITRVFIEGDTFTDEEKNNQIAEMERLKDHIHVRFVKESLLPPEARKNFGLIADRIYGYGSSTSRGWLFNDIRIHTRREELDKAKELAETIIKLSEEYK
jgi:hypothetical protein